MVSFYFFFTLPPDLDREIERAEELREGADRVIREREVLLNARDKEELLEDDTRLGEGERLPAELDFILEEDRLGTERVAGLEVGRKPESRELMLDRDGEEYCLVVAEEVLRDGDTLLDG